MDYLKQTHRALRHIVVVPIVSSLVIPLVIIDVWMELYHRICFPICKIPYVQRKSYIKIDRHKLTYLNPIQKVYCVYCGYGNGLLAYVKEIAGQTEKYWCGIQHKKTPGFKEQEHQKRLGFAKYGDKKDFERKYQKVYK